MDIGAELRNARKARKLSIEAPNMKTLLGLTRLFARNRGLYPQTRVASE